MGIFDFFYTKSLNLEIKKMMGQCDGFLRYALSLSKETKKDLLPSLYNKRKILDKILLIHRSERKLDGQSFLALKKLKKECVKIYKDNFNYIDTNFFQTEKTIKKNLDTKYKQKALKFGRKINYLNFKKND